MQRKPPITKADLKKAHKIATGPLMGGIKAKPAAEAPEEKAKVAPLGALGAVKSKLGRILDDQK